jgi:phosphoglycolate phosphatase-like HAD superfamily hydrolase
MPAAVIFDIDGTLVDSVDLHARAWQRALQQFGYDVPLPDVRAQIGKGGDQLLPVFVPAGDLERRGPDIEACRGELFKAEYLPRVRAFPAVRALFERILSAGQSIALASSAKQDEVRIYRRLADIDDLVTAQATGDDVERSKPHPDIFDVALERLGDPRPDDVIAVGDSPYDAEAAGKLGLATVGLLCGGFDAARLRAAGCVALYDDPADLLASYAASPLRSTSVPL